MLHRIIISEGSKVYHIKKVDEEIKEGLFLNYIRLSKKVAGVINELNPNIPFPNTLASNLFETLDF